MSNTSVAGAPPPSKWAVSPSGPASILVTFVFRWIAAYCLLIRFISGITMSRSAPGMIWSTSSTIVTFVPSE